MISRTSRAQRASLIAFISVTIIALTPVHAITVYTWKDSKGVTHYSDTPPEKGRSDKLHYNSAGAAPVSSHRPPAKEIQTGISARLNKDEAPKASSVILATPSDQETLRSNSGDISLSVSLDAPLGKNQALQVYLNNRPSGPRSTSLQWQLTNVDRGKHSIRVALLENGKEIASTPSVTVYLHRARVK
ncbi:DUF4124 domain-containing protein [Parasalinivibrio latis]|uniref:DUF4124 domain-containing protein n=1 Tax=Parasalinivibrio latis TaxID=2952610 RepID=UPI0030E3F482